LTGVSFMHKQLYLTEKTPSGCCANQFTKAVYTLQSSLNIWPLRALFNSQKIWKSYSDKYKMSEYLLLHGILLALNSAGWCKQRVYRHIHSQSWCAASEASDSSGLYWLYHYMIYSPDVWLPWCPSGPVQMDSQQSVPSLSLAVSHPYELLTQLTVLLYICIPDCV
jgi:hypothetical protein